MMIPSLFRLGHMHTKLRRYSDRKIFKGISNMSPHRARGGILRLTYPTQNSNAIH